MTHPNQQERFMISIVPPLMLMLTLAFWHRFHDKGYIIKNQIILRSIASISLIVNFVLLIPFTFAYGHKGLVEPLVWIERMDPKPNVLFVQPGMYRWIPVAYAGFEFLPRTFLRDWSDLDHIERDRNRLGDFDYLVLYPNDERELAEYVDSLESNFGYIREYRIFEPSLYDKIFHALNPSHYRTYKAYIYRPPSEYLPEN